MEQYLTEYDTLARVVDALISKKYQNQPPDNLSEIREEGIRKLDDKISLKVFGSLSDEQLEKISGLLDDQENDPAVFQKFFKDAGVNVEQKISGAVEEFSDEFLGGENV